MTKARYFSVVTFCLLVLVASQQGRAATLVANWRFDSTSGTTALDSVNGFHGTVVGTASWGANCNGDGHLDLSGSGNYVQIPNNASLNSTGDPSISGWFRLNNDFNSSTGTTQVIMEKFQSGAHNLHLALAGQDYTHGTVPKGALAFKMNAGTGNFRYMWTGRREWEAGVWYHFVLIIDTDAPVNNRLYINGQLDSGGSSGAETIDPWNFAADLRFGGTTIEQAPGLRYFDGQFNDFRIYSGLLTPVEIATQYGLILHWKMDETSGTTALDSSGLGYTGTQTAIVYDEGIIDGAYRFNGSTSQVRNDPVKNAINGLTSITVAVWVKSDNFDYDQDIFFSDFPTGNDDHLGLRFDENGLFGGENRVVKASISTNGGTHQIESSSNVQSTKWLHLAMTWNSGEHIQLYVNGKLNNLTYTDGPVSGNLNAVDRILLGVGTKNQPWEGRIDDFRIYNRALCAEEIDQIIGSGLPRGLRITNWREVR